MSKSKPKRGRYWVRRWHRMTGVVLLLPLLWLTGTGLVLRYADELGLETATVESTWLLEQYGMFPEGEVRVADLGQRRVAEWGEVLFLDTKMLDEVGGLIGAVEYGSGVVVATGETLLVYSASGEWEQRLGEESLPGLPIEAVGVVEGSVAVRVSGKAWKFDADLIGMEEVASEGVSWSAVAPGAQAELKDLKQAVASQAGIPWSRVFLDLHSGNLGGTGGKLLVDLTGLGIIVMSLLGLRLFFRKHRGATS